MAYFANGTEGNQYQQQFCAKCQNWRDNGDGRGEGCPVMDAHFLFAYQECNSNSNAKQILDMLIPMNPKTHNALLCNMFISKPKEDQQ